MSREGTDAPTEARRDRDGVAAHPVFVPAGSRFDDPTLATFDAAYALIANAFVYPEDIDGEALVARGSRETVPAVARRLDRKAADRLATFLGEYGSIDVDGFLATLELDPTCPPYVGHHAFDGPRTCHDVADADRNQYMVDLSGIYAHFGLALEGELPDYLPAMVEFLGHTLDARAEPLRDEFLQKLVDMLPPMIEAFADEGTPYAGLLVALRRVAAADLDSSPATTVRADLEDPIAPATTGPVAQPADGAPERGDGR